jgi:ribosomal protein S18 acetylase RimI-like enzyme
VEASFFLGDVAMVQLRMRHPNLQALAEMPPLPSDYTVRLYQEEDISSLTETLHDAFPTSGWTPETVRANLLQDPTVLATYVVAYEGKVVATASAQRDTNTVPPSCYLHWVATHSEHQGKKLGMMVSYAAMHYFRERGYTEALLLTDDPRTSAITIYLRMGFRPHFTDETHPERWETIFSNSGVQRPQ